LCRTSTPIVLPDKHSKFDSGTRKKRIKFVHIPGNETPNKHGKNVILVKENIQKSFEFEDRPHGGDSVLEQATSEFKSSENNSALDIAIRVQTIKMTGNTIKKFMYVPDNMEMKAAFTQNKSSKILMEDVIKSAEAMEKVVGTKAKHNDMGKFSDISYDRQELIPFCKLQESTRFVTSGESVEDLKRINAVTSRTDGTGKHVLSLRSCNNSLIGGRNNESSSIKKKCAQSISLSNQDNIKEFINASDGGTYAEYNDVSSVLCDFETCEPEEQSRAIIINSHDARKFLPSHETEVTFNASNTTCDILEHFNKQLDELPSSSKKEMEYEFSTLSQSTKMLGFSTATGKQIKLSDDALLKAKRLMDDIMTEEMVKVIPDVASKVPGHTSKCEELQHTKVNAVCPGDDDISCKHSNGTVEDKCDVADNVSRGGHIFNKKCYCVINSPMICASGNNKQETVMHAETKTHQNCDEAVTEETTFSLLENKRDQELMTDLQIVLAAERVELMQQLADDGCIFSQWPNEVHDQESKKCENINNPPTESKFHISLYAGEGSVSARLKETCASTHVARDPLYDGVSNDRDKHSPGKLTSLCTSGHQDVEMSEQYLQQGRQLHQKNIVCDSTIKEEKENNKCHKIVQNMKASDNEAKPHSEEVYMEEILNATVIRQLFDDNLDTFKIENRVQTAINKPENDVLSVDYSLPNTLDEIMQNERPEMAGFRAASREKVLVSDVSLQRARTCLSECDASNWPMIEAVPSKSGRILGTIPENMSTKMKTAELSRAIGRNRVMSGTALENILSSEAEVQKSETIQTVDSLSDTGSNKMTTLNVASSKPGLLENMGESEEMSEINMLVSINDNSFQEPVTNTRHLFEAESATPLQHPKVNGRRARVGKSALETTETSCSLFRTENHLQQLLPQSVTTANCHPVSVCEGIVDISEQLSVDNVEVPDENLAISSRISQKPGDSLQNVGSILDSANTLVVDGNTTVSGMKIVASTKAIRSVEHMSSETDANVNSTIQNIFSPVLVVPEALDSSLICTVSNAQFFEHEAGCSELERTKKKDSPVLQGFAAARGKKISVSAEALIRTKLLFSDKDSERDEIRTEPSEMKEMSEKVYPSFSNSKSTNMVQISEALSASSLVISEADTTTVEHETKSRELKERGRLDSPVLEGFTTASGKKVCVSTKALNRAKLLFSEEESCTELVKGETKVPELKEKEEQHSPVLQGFSTASGKKVSVSATALNRAKLLFTEEESCSELVEDETKVPELKEKEEQHSPVLQGFSTASAKKVSVSATALNRAKVLFSEVEGACTKKGVYEGDSSDLNVKKEILSQILQGLLPASVNHDSISAESLNRNSQFSLEEELDAYVITSSANYLEFEKSSLISEKTPQLEKVSVSKDKPRKVKLKLSRRVSGQNKSNSSFEAPQSEQINSSRPFFLHVNQRESQDCKQNTCISDETCLKAGTLNRFTNTSEFHRKLHRNSSPQVQCHSTGITATKVIKGKKRERDDTVIGTPPPDDGVTKECSKTDKVSISLTQEVEESAAALLADEAMFDSPSWIVSYLSCPDMVYDQDTAPTAVVCSEDKDCSAVTIVGPGSPVLGSHDRCRKRRRVKMIANESGHNSRIPASTSFKVNHLHFMILCFILFCNN
jgi:hypothetical protein